ncbi:MAG: SDR family oxidoreductase [Chloroflexota bacterium]
MRLLITGGSGYVGAGILRRAPKEWKIAATYFAHPLEQSGVAAFRVDIRNTDAVNQLFTEFRPDVVIHTAALMTGDAMMTTNVDGSRHIARAATRSFDSADAPLRTRLIHLSSDVIFDGEHAPYDENAAPAPITPYAKSKARAEQAVKEEHTHYVIARTSLVYGFAPMDPRTRQTLDGAMPRLFTDEYRCPIFVDDLADALIELAQNDFVGGLNIAGPQRLSRYAFGVKLARAFRVEPRFQPALSVSSPTPRPRDCALDIARARRILKTRLRSVDEVLQQN